jgi:hypothetical protein
MYYQVPGIQHEPEATLKDWQILKVTFDDDTSSFHLNGRCQYHGGRFSTAIKEFNKDTMIAVTSSGRVYQLIGESGYNSDAAYIAGVWLTRNRAKLPAEDYSEKIDEMIKELEDENGKML